MKLGPLWDPHTEGVFFLFVLDGFLFFVFFWLLCIFFGRFELFFYLLTNLLLLLNKKYGLSLSICTEAQSQSPSFVDLLATL